MSDDSEVGATRLGLGSFWGLFLVCCPVVCRAPAGREQEGGASGAWCADGQGAAGGLGAACSGEPGPAPAASVSVGQKRTR